MASNKISIKVLRLFLLFILQFLFVQNLIAVPLLISFQGQVLKDGKPYEGSGSFKFAFIDSSGQIIWRNDGLVVNGEPSESIELDVSRGVFSVLLGDNSISNMSSLNVDLFNNDNISVRVWFNGGGQNFDLLSPDTRITSVGYALKAKSVEELPNNIVLESSLSSSLKAKIQTIQNLEQKNTSNNVLINNLEAKVAALELATSKISSLENKVATLEAGVAGLGAVFTSFNAQEIGYKKIHSFPEDSWSSVNNSPSGRVGHAAVWSGSHMTIWGGEVGANTFLKTGNLYNLATDSWSKVSPLDAPLARSLGSYLLNENDLFIWGGITSLGLTNSGGIYKHSNQSWQSISVEDAPSGRYGNGSVWTGSRMLIWGGRNNIGLLNDLFVYDPSADQWQEININSNKPAVRYLSSVVLVGPDKVIIWGGVGVAGALGDGAVINLNNGIPDSSGYVSVNLSGAPASRRGHTALSTGDKMIIWGGGKSQSQLYSDGFIYNPSNDSWSKISNLNAPSARDNHASVWTGKEMLIIGGRGVTGALSDSYAYNPKTDVWRQLEGSVGKRFNSTAVWTGKYVLLFGGNDGQRILNNAMKLDPTPSVNLFVKE